MALDEEAFPGAARPPGGRAPVSGEVRRGGAALLAGAIDRSGDRFDHPLHDVFKHRGDRGSIEVVVKIFFMLQIFYMLL
jgi:hypothetical protein